MQSPRITVLAHARVPSPESDAEFCVGDALGVPLSDALTRDWDTDAHCTQYEPVAVPVLDSQTGSTDGQTTPVRLEEGCLAAGIVPRMVALIGDVDPPQHKFTDEWWVETKPRLEASGLAWYRTRNGARVVAQLAEPFEIRNTGPDSDWTRAYKEWCDNVEREHGIVLDRRCSDWQHLFRLPRVVRTGDASEVRTDPAWYIGSDPLPAEVPVLDVRAAAPAVVAVDQNNDRRYRIPGRDVGRAQDALIDRAIALAERVPPSVEGHGGDAALFHAACELQSILGENTEAIEAILTDVFNPRCLPPWPPSKIKLEAKRAAERAADPAERYARERRERELQPRPAREGNDEFASFVVVDRSAPIPELNYIVEGFDFAPGKVSVIQAFANVAKTPFALSLAAHVAAGKEFLGCAVQQAPVVFVAFEGGLLSELREERICRGLGYTRTELPIHYLRAKEQLSTAFLDELERFTVGVGAKIIIVDTYTSALPPEIDHNSSEFAHWLRQLGTLSEALDVTVVCLMHENKSDKADGLRGISGHNAAPGAIQAAIRLVRRSEDRNVIDVECTREVRKAFDGFSVRFSDGEDGSLKIERLSRDDAPTNTATTASAQEKIDAAKMVRASGTRIMNHLHGVEGHYMARELISSGGHGKRIGELALALLRDASFVSVVAGRYSLTAKGRAASEQDIAHALGKIGKFDKEA